MQFFSRIAEKVYFFPRGPWSAASGKNKPAIRETKFFCWSSIFSFEKEKRNEWRNPVRLPLRPSPPPPPPRPSCFRQSGRGADAVARETREPEGSPRASAGGERFRAPQEISREEGLRSPSREDAQADLVPQEEERRRNRPPSAARTSSSSEGTRSQRKREQELLSETTTTKDSDRPLKRDLFISNRGQNVHSERIA